MRQQVEQTSGVAEEILKDVPIGEGDLLLIVSVSGRNAVPVEMCTIAQQRGTTVIDLPGAVGDAAIAVSEDVPPVGPISSVVGAAILHGFMVETAMLIAARGPTPPVFASANLDDSAEWNEHWIKIYRDRLDYL